MARVDEPEGRLPYWNRNAVEKAHLEPIECLHRNANVSYSAEDHFVCVRKGSFAAPGSGPGQALAVSIFGLAFIFHSREASNTIWRLPQK